LPSFAPRELCGRWFTSWIVTGGKTPACPYTNCRFLHNLAAIRTTRDTVLFKFLPEEFKKQGINLEKIQQFKACIEQSYRDGAPLPKTLMQVHIRRNVNLIAKVDERKVTRYVQAKSNAAIPAPQFQLVFWHINHVDKKKPVLPAELPSADAIGIADGGALPCVIDVEEARQKLAFGLLEKIEGDHIAPLSTKIRELRGLYSTARDNENVPIRLMESRLPKLLMAM